MVPFLGKHTVLANSCRDRERPGRFQAGEPEANLRRRDAVTGNSTDRGLAGDAEEALQRDRKERPGRPVDRPGQPRGTHGLYRGDVRPLRCPGPAGVDDIERSCSSLCRPRCRLDSSDGLPAGTQPGARDLPHGRGRQLPGTAAVAAADSKGPHHPHRRRARLPRRKRAGEPL